MMKVSRRFMVGISRYQPSDAGELAEFQRKFFGDDARQLDPAHYAWRYEHNSANDGAPGIWVCRRKDAIVGQQAEIPVDLVIDGTDVRAAWAIDLMVDPEWRMRGVGPGLVATQLEDHQLVAGVTQPAEAFKAYMRAGWLDVGVMPIYVRPLAGRLLRAAPFSTRLRPLAPIAAPALAAADAVLGRALWAAGFRIERVGGFDERVDEVWAAAAADYPVLAKRDAKSTIWRVDGHPESGELFRFYLTRRGRTVGYVAFRMQTRWDEHVAQVVDYLAPRRLVPALLTAAAREGRRLGGSALVCPTKCEPLDRALRNAGFVRRGVDVPAPLRLVVHCTGPDRLCETVGASANWFLTAADSDMT
jgi:GNAT superfamily N-acetyltransferase